MNIKKLKALQVVKNDIKHFLIHQLPVEEICWTTHVLKIYQIQK